jgi:hypothetical protein
MSGDRPFGVTLVAVIAWISGALQVLSGIFALFAFRPLIGSVSIVIGIVTILVSIGLFGGRSGARVIVTIVFLLNIAAAIWIAFSQPDQTVGALLGAVLPLIGMILLYTSRANAYFAR